MVGAGELVGELGLVTGSDRRATVTALTTAVVEIGDADSFLKCLQSEVFVEKVARSIADRLASLSVPATIALREGGEVTLRPGLKSDRSALDAGLAAMSRESLRRRFFSGGMPPKTVIDRLAELDYVDHFAWVASDGAEPDGDLIGSARFFRSDTDPTAADVSFGVIDRAQGRGVGYVLVEAIAVAAGAAGIRRLTADVLRDNGPMLSLLRRPNTRSSSRERGVVHLDMQTSDFGTSLPVHIQHQLAEISSSIIWHTAALLAGFDHDFSKDVDG